MRLLYLHYGPQSGVTTAVTRALAARGVDVAEANPTERFAWQIRPGSRIPNPRPTAIRAFFEALRGHGWNWKAYFVHTTWAFDRLSERAGEAIRRLAPDAVLQSGVLFGPGLPPPVPFHLYVDHTRAIAERYEAVPGLVPPLPENAAWRAREEAVYRGAAAIFAMSAFVKESLVRDYGVEEERVHVVGAGPNVEPAPAAAGGEREKAILFVGRDFASKGGPDLLDAFARVRRDHPDASLWIVSSSAPAALPERAVFLGTLGAAPLARLYARASVFALPTLREAFGLVFLEAMAFGVPVVATAIEAIPEIVADGETGLLVPPRDPAALARALSALLADPGRARLFGAAGRARVRERFGWDRAAAAMLRVMRPGRGAGLDRGGRAPAVASREGPSAAQDA